MSQRLLSLLLLSTLSLSVSHSVAADRPASLPAKGSTLPNPILFVAQIPVPGPNDESILSTFANHLPDPLIAGRGGDLFIRYPDGTLRNLTREAGFGEAGVLQGANSISVRDPNVHWQGNRALFSMVIGAPLSDEEPTPSKWQLYEVTGLGPGDSAAITRVAGQPADYNNVGPIYVNDGRIVFSSDRPRGGEAHLYPQLDEYDSLPTPTGLWSLDPTTHDLRLLQHSPSGSFEPFQASDGRILFSRWDHLQRDKQFDEEPNTVRDYPDESAGATPRAAVAQEFPEPREPDGSNLLGLTFNQFGIWEIRPDGTAEETLNHIGRHELSEAFTRTFNDDPALLDHELGAGIGGHLNRNAVENLLQVREDPQVAGRFLSTNSPLAESHASGQLVRIDGSVGISPDLMEVVDITHPDTVTFNETPNHSGHYRDPLVLSDGTWLAAHTTQTGRVANLGSLLSPVPNYDFQLKTLAPRPGDGYHEPASTLLAQRISRNVQYWTAEGLLTYSGPLWEIQPVEITSRAMPAPLAEGPIVGPERQIFDEVGVDETTFRQDLVARDLALIISRNVTSRDDGDVQQPFNLRVAGTTTQTTGSDGTLYDVSHLQIFQAEMLRTGPDFSGRRPLPTPLRDPNGDNPPSSGGPAGSVALGPDGSMAALVPARRATSWQLTDPSHAPVVRERYWVTFQPGEIRVCTACHGVNRLNQAGGPSPQNPPEALRTLLQHWQGGGPPQIFADGFESGDLSGWSQSR
ncbi:MAG: hypothetical protein AAF560_22925 [Acidobacteriota bacterium]